MPSTLATTTVAYQVRLHPARHEIDVQIAIDGPAAVGTVRLATPTWTPGDYAFETFGRDVFGVAAADPRTGAPLAVTRDGWQGYRVDACSGAVRVTYTANCASNDLSEECGILGDRNGVLLGTRYLRVVADAGPCRVTYDRPEGWALHHPAGATQVAEATWEYPSYEILLDTPVVFGAFDCLTRDVRGTPFHHLFLTRGVGFESRAAAFVDRLVQVAEQFHDIFGSFPFDNYTYVLSLNPADNWGLEHLTSTMIGLDPGVFFDADQDAIGVRTCAHELFHAWNVRRLRPAPLGHLDLTGGSFSEGLWVAEGFTRYYEFLTCTRTGVYSPQQFFSAVVNYYRHLAALPAYQRVSAIDASRATYLNHDKYPGRVNNAIDYYDKGMVIAFNLDAALRVDTADASLDSAFRAFYDGYAGRGAGYTPNDVFDFFGRYHDGLRDQLAREAGEPGGLALVAQLERLGFAVALETVPYIGLVLQDDSGPGIYGVLDTSPAGESGIAAEDVITRVDGYPFSLAALRWSIANQTSVTLDVRRGNQPRRYRITVGRREQIGSLVWTGTSAQAARIAAWLRRDFAPAYGEPIALDFYENFHGIETVI